MFQLQTAGSMPTVEVLESQFLPVEKAGRKTALSVTHSVKRATKEMGQCVGKPAPMASRTLEVIALSLHLMEEEQDMFSGKKASARKITHKDVRNGVLSGILNARKASTMLHAVSAHQTASTG